MQQGIRIESRGGHRWYSDNPVLRSGNDNDLRYRDLCDWALRDVTAMPGNKWDRLANPFEAKWLLHDKMNLPANLAAGIAMLEREVKRAAEIFEIPSLAVDPTRYWAGVFRYGRGDHLAAHVDAGIHPPSKKRKHVTALLYLGYGMGDLELWEGGDCNDPAPKLTNLVAWIPPTHGQLLVFENGDRGWHGASINHSDMERIVLTVSYLSDEVTGGGINNMREKAFFMPKPGEVWDADTYALRDKRADMVGAAGVYRYDLEKERRHMQRTREPVVATTEGSVIITDDGGHD